MRRWLSRALLAAMLAAFCALVATESSGCRLRAETKPPVLKCKAPKKPVAQDEVVYQPQDPCDWEGTCDSYLLRLLLGCECEAGGGSSGAKE